MFGLSITAIGKRSLAECISIYKELKAPLNLSYLELAVGSACHVEQLTSYDEPLLLHDSCLYKDGKRLMVSLLNTNNWAEYKRFIDTHDVKHWAIHPPLVEDITKEDLKDRLYQFSEYMNISIDLEVMPSPNYWMSKSTMIRHVPILTDISHINLWEIGDHEMTSLATYSLMSESVGSEIHLSHNDGKRDSHDLIPNDIWFNPLIELWDRLGYYVTYESLPTEFADYERLDKRRKI